MLAVGNGSACRTEKAPGHFDERAAAFDAGLGRCLKDGRLDALAAIDHELAHELWASVDAIVEMARVPDVSLGAGRLRRRSLRRAVLGRPLGLADTVKRCA